MATKDRLNSLKAARKLSDRFSKIIYKIDRKSHLKDEFFQEVEQLRETIESMQTSVDEMKKIHSAILIAPQTDNKVKQQLDDLMAEIKRTANSVRTRLKAINSSIDQLAPTSTTATTIRIRRTQLSMLLKKFAEVMADYNTIQIDYRHNCKARIQRQLEITGRSTTDEELETMLDSENPNIFTQSIKIITDSRELRQRLADIEARHADIIKLENSIRELHDMFMDMALVVDIQGETIDSIEQHVRNAGDYVETGVQDFKPALKWQRKSRRKKLILVAIGLTIVCIVVVAIII
ncbi:syntaxin-1A-like [Oppia nitens]|uniref:syntaxin-1A-like n=1 Tax=Oppia nitens TaxID=1686743 RepID=UPI0023DC770E|nr:syntaxin-1A-like [Oppia nitens]